MDHGRRCQHAGIAGVFCERDKKGAEAFRSDFGEENFRDFLKWEVVVNDGESVLDAIDIHKKYHYSFWDSLIVEAALKS